jgi:hypothetical protein
MTPGRTFADGPEAGFTLLETIIVLVLSLVVFGGFSLTITDAVDVGVQGVGAADLQEVGRHTLERIKRDVQATGRFSDPALGLLLPHVFSNGQPDALMDPNFAHDGAFLASLAATFPPAPPLPAPTNPPPFVAPGSELEPLGIREMVFRLPADNDGDGRIVSSTTGTIEWGPGLVGWLVIPNGQGTLDLVRRSVDAAGIVTDDAVCRCVEALTFDSVDTKNILPFDAIEIHLHLRRVTARGQTQRLHLATTVVMRNS